MTTMIDLIKAGLLAAGLALPALAHGDRDRDDDDTFDGSGFSVTDSRFPARQRTSADHKSSWNRKGTSR